MFVGWLVWFFYSHQISVPCFSSMFSYSINAFLSSILSQSRLNARYIIRWLPVLSPLYFHSISPELRSWIHPNTSAFFLPPYPGLLSTARENPATTWMGELQIPGLRPQLSPWCHPAILLHIPSQQTQSLSTGSVRVLQRNITNRLHLYYLSIYPSIEKEQL